MCNFTCAIKVGETFTTSRQPQVIKDARSRRGRLSIPSPIDRADIPNQNLSFERSADILSARSPPEIGYTDTRGQNVRAPFWRQHQNLHPRVALSALSPASPIRPSRCHQRSPAQSRDREGAPDRGTRRTGPAETSERLERRQRCRLVILRKWAYFRFSAAHHEQPSVAPISSI
jgi:hypothetical protein